MSTQDLVAGVDMFELDQRRAKAYAQSGYWPDAADLAKALVKIEAGRSLGLPAIVAMSEIHVIDGKPTLGAGGLAALVKASGRYDYRVVELNNELCQIRFYDRDERLYPLSEFTLEDARAAGLLNKGPWKQYPRNMLFARAISNGVAWHCPDVTSGRVYVPEELGGDQPGLADVEWPDSTVQAQHQLEYEQEQDDDDQADGEPDEVIVPEPPEPPDPDEPEIEFRAPPGVQTPLG